MLVPIVRFLRSAARLDADAFAREHPDPVLVIEPFVGGGERTSFETLAPGPGGSSVGRSVAILRKREGANAFGMMVTLGRATNNDVQIPNPQVSKFHAYVMFDAEGRASLNDAGSTHGTFVAGRRLAPKTEKALLEDGVVVRLGPVKATYYSPAAFFAYLTSQ